MRIAFIYIFFLFGLYPQQLNISVPIRVRQVAADWQSPKITLLAAPIVSDLRDEFNMSIFSHKAELLWKQRNNPKPYNNCEKSFQAKGLKSALCRARNTCHFALQMSVKRFLSAVFVKTRVQCISVQIMTWSKGVQMEVHFAMHMSLFDGKIRQRMFEHSTFSHWTLSSF